MFLISICITILFLDFYKLLFYFKIYKSKILGHKNIEITLNVYTSVFNKFTIEEVNKINDVF